MKYFFALLFSSFIINANTQITVNSSDFVNGQDSVLVSVVTDFTNVNFIATGANSVWDYSQLIVDHQRVDSFESVSTLGIIYQLSFGNFLSPAYQASYYKKESSSAIPTTGLPVTISDPISFHKVSSSKVEFVGTGANFSGVDLPSQLDTIDVIYELPMNFSDNWTSNSYLYTDLNPIYNAIYKRNQYRSSIVDGYGSVTTPFGTFDALRVKSEITYNDSIFTDLFGTGGFWIGIPTPTAIEYTWWANSQKIPVLKIVTNENATGELISSVEFRDDVDYTSLDQNESNNLLVYPNPANDFINLKVTNETNINSIKCFHTNGKLMFETSNIQKEYSIITSDWSPGIYFIKVESDHKSTTQKIIIH